MVLKKLFKKKPTKRIEPEPAPEEIDFVEEEPIEEDESLDEDEGEDYDEDMGEPELPPIPVPSPRRSRKPVPKKSVWEVRSVPIQSQNVAYNNKTGETFDVLSALVKILNVLEE